MRAVAVGVVVAYHAGVPGFAGGFVGVDVFFVLSGYLITRLLLGELAATGTIALGEFWGRRARRLLPAAALTVVVTALGALVVLPPLAVRQFAGDALGAATFTSNFVFAHRLGDYFGAQLGAAMPSPLLHFWSLAVEEQFYLLWPPLLALLTRRPRRYRQLAIAVAAALTIVGFVAAAMFTSSHPTAAFFLLPTRMGELLAGALVALSGPAVLRLAAAHRAVLGWVGLGGIAWSTVAFDEAVAWPGVAVLAPVVATVAVIVAGVRPVADEAPVRVLRAMPLQWVGRHSYAIYLWHWPVLVLAAAQFGPLGVPATISAVAISVAFAALSVALIEDPVRHWRPLTHSAPRSLVLGASLCLVVALVSVGLRSTGGDLDGGVAAAAPELDVEAATSTAAQPDGAATPAAARGATPSSTVAGEATSTTGAPTTSAPSTSDAAVTTLATPPPPGGQLGQLVQATQQQLRLAGQTAVVPNNLRPSLASARERSTPYRDGCVNVGVNDALQPCEYGVTTATSTIVLYGDSHAAQWFEPLEQVATARGMRLVVLLKGGCPVSDVDVPTPVLRYTCPPYRDRALAYIEREQPALVVAAQSYNHVPAEADEWQEGTLATFERLGALGVPVLVIGDNPASLVDPPACLSDHVSDVDECVTTRDDAVRPQRISSEVLAAEEYGLTWVDTTNWFCTTELCPLIIGNVLVLRDETHITVPMAEFLTPLVGAAVSAAL